MKIKDPALQLIFKGIKFLYVALLAGCLSLLAVVFYVNKSGNGLISDNQNTLLGFWYVAIAMLAVIPLAYYLFRKKIRRINSEMTLSEKLMHYRSAYFIKLAILEGACFISTIMFMLTNNKNIFYQTLIILLVLALNYPGKSAAASEINLTPEESDQL